MKSFENKESLLIEKIRGGDKHAFEIAFLKYYEQLFQFSWTYVRSKAAAEDITQDVFTSFWVKRSQLDPEGHLRGLLFEATRNTCLNYIKHQKIVDQYIAESREQMEGSYEQIDIHEKEGDNIDQITNEVIDHLPEKARRIYNLNRKEGLTYKEIANYLGISVKTVESQMRRILKILRKQLSQYLTISIIIGSCLLWLSIIICH